MTLTVRNIKHLLLRSINIFRLLMIVVTYAVGVQNVFSNEAVTEGKEEYFSSKVSHPFPDSVYWGDTHLHTNRSMDAYNFGNRKLGPEEAYRFAKGETVTANNGLLAKLERPLDFLVIADHATNMGVMQGLEVDDTELLKSAMAKNWALRLKAINDAARDDVVKAAELSLQLFNDNFKDGVIGSDYYRHAVWKESIALADVHNIPGKFTALIGYEWTLAPSLHRVIIFKDAADKAGQVIPFSQYDSQDPEKLWSYLAEYETNTGGEVLAIPHNSNLSQGNMFALVDAQGRDFSSAYATTRSRWEPLLEVTQIKGDSEAHPLVSVDDEFADYETLPPVDRLTHPPIKKDNSKISRHPTNAKNTIAIIEQSYARSALKSGLSQQAKLGVNPFKFGMIGSTDSHTSLATADDDNFWGKLSGVEPDPRRMSSGLWGVNVAADYFSDDWDSNAWRMAASGYAGIWAQENTRESLFSAMKRKEVYASTGPRITVRFFGGWDYQSSDAFSPELAKIGYNKGVPMGGDLTHAPNNKSPQFLIRAVKDPEGANLDRVQVIKGWHDAKGQLHEKVYDVVLSDHRKPNWRGKVKPVGNTVDVADASYTNTIGDPELAVVWTDPDFDQDELAFYYVRVLEIPTPRWTAYDAKFFGLKDLPEEIPMVTQERAYTSPIWFTPEG